MSEPIFFGEDLGAGANKLYGDHGGINFRLSSQPIPANRLASYLDFATENHQ